MPDPMHFDARADTYERGRPPYPEALWSCLRDFGLLRPELRVVELGAGTGQATARFLAAGADVTAVEPGRALARRLRERCPRAQVVVARAEDADLGDARYDLAVAATSVHWLDLAVVLPRLRRALVPGGRLAVWRTAFGDPDRAITPFRDRVAAIVADRGSDAVRPGPGELDTEEWERRLSSTGEFAVVHVDHYRWSIDLDAGQIHDLFATFSDWSPDEVAAAADAVRQLGGTVTEHYVTPLILLTRADHVSRGL